MFCLLNSNYFNYISVSIQIARVQLCEMEEEFAKSLQQSVNNQFGKGQYQVLEPLKRGGHGYVYKARIIKQEKLVALKALPKSHISFDFSGKQNEKKHQTSPQLIKIALNEIKVHETVKSNFVVRLYKWFEDQYNLNMILDYYPNGDLGELLRQSGKNGLPLQRVRAIGWSIAKGILRIHECSIVHRDIKPANILMANEDDIKICDFSCAVKVHAKKSQPSSNKVMGTLSYMAPEIVSKPCEYKLDVWAFGVLLYEICAGQLPFKHTNHSLTEIHKMINQQQLLSLKFPGKFSKLLRDLLNRIFVIDPNQRMGMADIVSHQFFTGQTLINEDSPSPQIVSSKRAKQTNESNIYKMAASTFREGKDCRKTCIGQSLQGVNRPKTTDNYLFSVEQPGKTSPSFHRQHPQNYLDANKQNKAQLANDKQQAINKNTRSNKTSSWTQITTKPHTYQLPRKVTNRISPLNCEGLSYEYRQKSDQMITIDETGFTKHYLRKNNYKRYHISPKGTHIELTINNSVKKYNLSTLPERHVELYDQFKECVKQIKARDCKGGSCGKGTRDSRTQLNRLMDRKLKAASSDKFRRESVGPRREISTGPNKLMKAKYTVQLDIGWNLLLEIRLHRKQAGKKEIYLIFKASQPPRVLEEVAIADEAMNYHQFDAILTKHCPAFDRYGTETAKSLCNFVKQSISWMTQAPNFSHPSQHLSSKNNPNATDINRKKTYSQEQQIPILKDDFIRQKLRCR